MTPIKRKRNHILDLLRGHYLLAILIDHFSYYAGVLGWLLIKFGKNSLSTYIIQSVVLFAAYYIPLNYGYWKSSFYTNVIIIMTWVVLTVYKAVESKLTRLSKIGFGIK